MYETLFYSLLLSPFLLLAITKLLKHAILTSHINLPPSPLALPILGHLHLLKQPLHRTLYNLSKCHGPIFSLLFGSHPVVVLSSPSAVEDCFGKNDLVLANRPRLALGKYVGYNSTGLGLSPYGPHWRNLRRLVTLDLFSSSSLNASTGIRRDEVKLSLRKLYQVSACGNFIKVEMKSMFSELVFNIVMRLVAGKRYYGGGDEASGIEEAKEFRELIEELCELAVSSYPGDFLPVLQWIDYNGHIKRLKKAGRKADKFLQGLVDEHRSNKDAFKKKNTMLCHLLTLQESEPEYYTDETIKALILVMLNAGTGTTAVTLEWAMSNLLNHHEILQKARNELDTQVGQEHLIEEIDLPKLQYLKNIISETLRLYPATPLLVPHFSSNHCTLGGYDISPNTIVFVNAWAIQRDSSLWEDSTSFKPEKFESDDKEGDAFPKLLPFGMGRRAYPGMGLANRVLRFVSGSLIQCFEWKRVSEKRIDMNEGKGLTMPEVEPLEAMCKPRSIASKVF
ncbi:hypothetical protein GOBAR_AA12269 [Gossypium barbadense]|uniref:Cytochrome P450 n=1 Tax=Gossypium barbadense TaxID=3634 RepID=A0A2P5XYF9_GOSBA|nr:hypothetical protein GOBAR_AA12269 [Gossypium barbadense]